MSEIGRRMREARRAVRKRDRATIAGEVDYQCLRCSMKINVGIAIGVLPITNVALGLVPVPREIECEYCGGDMELDGDSYRFVEPSVDVAYSRYLRVPSRRAGAQMAREGRLEAQLVVGDR